MDERDLSLILQRVAAIKRTADAAPDLRWAVVAAVSPLRVTFDGESSPDAGSPDTLVTGLTVGARVLCAVQHQRVTVVGVGQGRDSMRRTFPTKAALDAFTGWPGLIGYVEAENSEYLWASGWQLWSSSWQAWTPISGFAGFTVGNGSWVASYSTAHGWATVSLRFTLGSTSAITGDVWIGLPLAGISQTTLMGTGRLTDVSTGVTYPASVIVTGAQVVVRSSGTTINALSSSSPFAWAAGDRIEVSFGYPL